ncbi:hypothetical protein FA95DRAFT_1486750, partial [Auriscalpium vulgare]
SMDEILNRIPSISEDTLVYALYPRPDSSDRNAVTAFALAIQSFVDTALSGFIWHRDTFELKVVEDSDTSGWILEGRMRVGDSIDDEWCAVWLLREISAKWDLAISVYDSDEEFMLIEAAEVLPSWVSPDIAENRVWIYQSNLHLIPLSYSSPPSSKRRRRRLPGAHESDDEGDASNVDSNHFLSVSDALAALRNVAADTASPSAVAQAVWKRIDGYPDALRKHIHTAQAYLPVDIAKALSVDHTLVQRAVEAFYTRDAVQLRAAHKMARFPPEPSVPQLVKLTRTAYAQLLGQKFYPPKIFGRWQERDGSPQWRWKDVGMKIACGFEMLYQESKGRTERATTTLQTIHTSAEARKDSLRRDAEYTKYIQGLVSAGYFKSEVEGSQLWTELEDKAVDVYIQTRQDDDASRPSFARQANVAIAKASDPEPATGAEDPDDWLNVDFESFDSVLETNLSSSQPVGNAQSTSDAMDVDEHVKQESAEDRAAKVQAVRMQELAKKVETFLEGKGDVEGAKFEDEQSSDDESSEFSDEVFSESESDSEDVPDEAARREAMDKLVPSLDPSEYGQMPASYYSQSQRVAPATIDNDVVADASESTPAPSAEQQRTKPIRAPILLRDRYEGVDSDDETEDEDEGPEDEEEEDDRPQVVGDIEVDMEEEEDEFLEFSRQALGISDEQWGDILRERQSRGGHKPPPSAAGTKPGKAAADSTTQLRKPVPGPRPNANPNLDSFEAVMQAMEAELEKSRAQKVPFRPPAPTATPKTDKGKGKGKAPTVEEDVDIETAMDAELRAALDRDDGDEDDDELQGDGGMELHLIKNFLESFKSQGGMSGPVSNLAGRLQPNWGLPRDDQ